MPEEKELEIEPTETQAAILQELDDSNVEPSPVSIDWQTTAEIAKQSAIKEQSVALSDSVALTLPDQFKALAQEKGSEEALRALTDRISRLREQQKKNWFSDIVYGAVQALVSFLADFWLIGSYAQIQGEATRLQPLRKAARPALLGIGDALTYYIRNPEYKSELWETLQRAGYKDTDIERLIKLQEVIPSGMDVVSFMVREVYSPDIVEKFQQLKGFDELYKQAKSDADRAGIPEATLKKYWASHWQLPGINQAYEMLHRGRINRDTLELILRAADIMPGFIQPLIDISFNPLTRVDVRRMHKLNILDREQVRKAYKDIGYNDANAEYLTRFTEEYNKEKVKSEKTTERDLSRADIETFYKMSLYTEAEALTQLQAIGYSKAEARLYIDRVDLKKELDIIDGYVNAYKKAYTRRLWDRQKTTTELNVLSLPHNYIEYLIDIWTIDRELQTERPSKAELLGWLKKKVITEFQARDELKNLGYSDYYIDMYIRSTLGR
jgi:hypothetical protein